MENKPIIVLISEGKGRGSIDFITPRLFNTETEANEFVKNTIDLESKYWKYAEIIKDGERTEPYYYGTF